MTRSSIGFALLFGAVALGCGDGARAAVDAGSVDGATQDIREATGEIPCEPRHVLEIICQQCHTSPMKNGAPFPLIRRADVLAVRRGAVVRDLMIRELRAKRMPLTPVTIDDAERETLLAWLEAGAPAATTAGCTTGSEGSADGGAGSSSTTGDGGAGAPSLDIADAGDPTQSDASPDGAAE